MNIDVKGRCVVVAGGSRGIGRAIALGFAAGGAQVSICARGPEALEQTRAEIAALGGMAHAATCDLSSEAAIARYIPEAAAALGGIDVLVNNATARRCRRRRGELGGEPVGRPPGRRARVARGDAVLAKGRDPTIINIASGSGLNPSVRTPAYGAAKAAVIHYTRTQAAALAMQGIRVNCVAPGSIEFPGGSGSGARATIRRSTTPSWPRCRPNASVVRRRSPASCCSWPRPSPSG